MPSCILRYCSNSSRKSNKSLGVTFHRFPRPDQENREKWIKFVQKDRSEEWWLPTDHSMICSVHFKEADKYTTKTGRVYLKKSAVPHDNFQITKSEEPELLDPLADSEPLTKSGEPEISETLSEPVSDSESIFDSPSEILLKNQLRKVSAAKNKLVEKLKKVQRQNNYLKKKCTFYKTILKKLKDKYKVSLNSNTEIDLGPLPPFLKHCLNKI